MVKRKRKRMSAGEIRFRVSSTDLERITWLMDNHPEAPNTISAFIRLLIAHEYHDRTYIPKQQKAK